MCLVNRNITIDMGISKTHVFTERQNKLAAIAKAFAHPARLAIIEHLLRIDGCVCGDIVDEIGLAQATVSQHLKELKKVGIIRGKVEGTSVCYCIDPENWRELTATLSEFMNLKTTCC